MNHLFNIVSIISKTIFIIGAILIGLVLVYVTFRLIGLAVAKSWRQANESNIIEGEENGKKER